MRVRHAILAVGLAATAARAQEGLPVEMVTALKDATVMIATAEDPDGEAATSGSGFLIRVEGRTGFVVTNHHVISPQKGLFSSRPTTRVVLRAGTRAERKATAEVVAVSAERDLAVLKVTDVPDLPAPIDVRKEPELVETMPVYVFGFPFGESLAVGRGRTSVVVGRGSVSSVRRDEDGTASAVLIDGALNPGNSGGPVVDSRGRLVGIAVAAVRDAHIGIAIAPPELLAMLGGRPEGLNATVRAARDGAVELAVDVPLVDPLGNIKKVALLYSTALDPAPDEVGAGAPPGEKTVELQVEPHRATGSVTLPARPGSGLDLTYRVAYDDGRAPTARTKPGHFLLSLPPTGGADPGRPGASIWGDLVNPDGDCTVRVAGGAVAVEIPGTHHDLITEPPKLNAPRLLQEVEGDFTIVVKVAGEFHPAGPPTRAVGPPYVGAGLLVWLDADNFIRIERGAVPRNGQVGALFLLERRESGRLNARSIGPLEVGDAYLKLERRGSRIAASYGTDGLAWAEAKPMDVAWPARLKVGLEAVSSSFEPFPFRFEEFSVRPPAPDAPK